MKVEVMSKYLQSFLMFAVSTKSKNKDFDFDPIGEKDNQVRLFDHFESLAKIFNEN